VVSTFCSKRLFGYASMVYATVVITRLPYRLAAPLFTMGSGRSELVLRHHDDDHLIPTGAKIQLALHDVPRPALSCR
jgi:cytochrome o ubiquinol oxidase subunit 1